jgi:ATP/ADP translocase
MVLFGLISVVWIYALLKLNREYQAALKNVEQEVI